MGSVFQWIYSAEFDRQCCHAGLPTEMARNTDDGRYRGSLYIANLDHAYLNIGCLIDLDRYSDIDRLVLGKYCYRM